MKTRHLIIAAALLAASVALAATHSVTWSKADTNTDGTPIPATGEGSITTTVEYGTCNGAEFGTKIADVVTASAGTGVMTPNLAPGTYCFRAKHTNTYGVDSDWTPTAQLVEVAPKPNPPRGLTVR